MKEGQASKTAVRVCMSRALAHRLKKVERFSDPTALTLLPQAERDRVAQFRDEPPKRFRERATYGYLVSQASMTAARTLEIDDAIRSAHASQVVILGAGLDGRAWRMNELADAVVFEVDHPDSQRDKRTRVSSLEQVAKDVRFVAVDFTRDSLDAALESAGHDPRRPTTWVWEGVVMYLTRDAIESTLAVMQRRSAPGSRVIVVYHSPAAMLLVVGYIVGRLGEPLRSAFTSEEMQALLARYGFHTVKDVDMPTIAAGHAIPVQSSPRMVKHIRIATADWYNQGRR